MVRARGHRCKTLAWLVIEVMVAGGVLQLIRSARARRAGPEPEWVACPLARSPDDAAGNGELEAPSTVPLDGRGPGRVFGNECGISFSKKPTCYYLGADDVGYKE